MTIVQGRFEWDDEKNMANKQNHGFSFEEILDVFDDPYFYEIFDRKHSTLEEERLIGLGSLNGLVVVTTCYTKREKIRLISSRFADKGEEALYYDYVKNFNT